MGARRRQHDARDSLGMLPWYPRDWRASSARARLSHLGRLAYRELLDAAWLEGGSLPADDRSLAGLAGFTAKEWLRVKAEVLTCFEKGEDGRLRQRRLTWEHARASQLRDSRRRGAERAQKGDNKTRSATAQRVTEDTNGGPLSDRSVRHASALPDPLSAGIPSTDTDTDTDTDTGKRRASGRPKATAPPPAALPAPSETADDPELPDHDPSNEDEASLARRVAALAERLDESWVEVLRIVSMTPGGKYLDHIRGAPPDWIRQTLRACDAFEADTFGEEG